MFSQTVNEKINNLILVKFKINTLDPIKGNYATR